MFFNIIIRKFKHQKAIKQIYYLSTNQPIIIISSLFNFEKKKY